MTAFSGPDRDQLRQQLAEVFPHEGYCALWMPRGKPCQCRDRERTLDALLPVVEAHTRAARVDELEQAAKAWRWSAWSDVPRVADRAAERIGTANYVGDWIAARAEALRPHEGDTNGQ